MAGREDCRSVQAARPQGGYLWYPALVRARGGGVKSPQPVRRGPVWQHRIRAREFVGKRFGTGLLSPFFSLYVSCLTVLVPNRRAALSRTATRPAPRRSVALSGLTSAMHGKGRDRRGRVVIAASVSRGARCAIVKSSRRAPVLGRTLLGMVRVPVPVPGRAGISAAVSSGARRGGLGRHGALNLCRCRPCRCPEPVRLCAGVPLSPPRPWRLRSARLAGLSQRRGYKRPKRSVRRRDGLALNPPTPQPHGVMHSVRVMKSALTCGRLRTTYGRPRKS